MDEAPLTENLYPCRNCGELRSNRFSHDCRQKQIDDLKVQLAALAKTLELVREYLVHRHGLPEGMFLP